MSEHDYDYDPHLTISRVRHLELIHCRVFLQLLVDS
jgi:hypothetical protein